MRNQQALLIVTLLGQFDYILILCKLLLFLKTSGKKPSFLSFYKALFTQTIVLFTETKQLFGRMLKLTTCGETWMAEGPVEEPVQLRTERTKLSHRVKLFDEHVALICDVVTCKAWQARH